MLSPVNFILSYLIVFHHAFTCNINYNGSYILTHYGFTATVERYMYNISECAVPIFFFVSSYLFYRTYDGTWVQYKAKIVRRFYSLFIPYVIFCTFGYFKHVINTGIKCDVLDYLQSLLKCNTMPLWFIRELIILSILAIFIYKIRKNLSMCIFVSIVVSVLIVLGIVVYDSFIYWLPVYFMGSLLTDDKLDKLKCLFESYKHTASFLTILYVIGAWFLPNGIAWSKMTWDENLFFFIFRLLSPVVGLYLICVLSKYNFKERFYMKYSFFVYCIHFPVITILGLLFEKYIRIDNNLVKYVWIVFFTYPLCVIMALSLKNYLPRLWYILNGRR